ncbi:MAG: TRAP transporter small permease [Pseudorhodobacter sp.]
MAALVAVIHAVETALRIVAALCLAAMLALMVAQVMLRYTGAGVPAFTEEVARYAMIWMALMASAVAVREGSHIRVDFIPSALAIRSPGMARMLELLLDAIVMAVFVVIFWQGVELVQLVSNQRSDGLRISLAWPYLILPLAFGIGAVFALARLIARERLA